MCLKKLIRWSSSQWLIRAIYSHFLATPCSFGDFTLVAQISPCWSLYTTEISQQLQIRALWYPGPLSPTLRCLKCHKITANYGSSTKSAGVRILLKALSERDPKATQADPRAETTRLPCSFHMPHTR